MIDKLSTPAVLPSHSSNDELANDFAKFFDQKVKKIRSTLDNEIPPMSSVAVKDTTTASFVQFRDVSQDDVRKFVMKSAKKSCMLDALPMSLFLHVVDDLLPVLTKIINKSFSDGRFPDSHKVARVMPLIKKPSLDSEDMKSYRPISNLRFDSKLLERVAVSQLQEYLKENALQSSKQSAYREGCSTEESQMIFCRQ